LVDNKDSFAKAVVQFRGLTQETKQFFGDNKDTLSETLTSLQKTTSVLSDNRQSIADLLQLAPTAISNFYNILDPRGPAITGELSPANLGDPAYLICGALTSLGGTTTDCRNALGPLVQYLKISAPPIGIGGVYTNGVGPGGVADPDDENTLKGGSGKANAETDPSGPADTDLLGQLASMPGGKS
jgi:phospholipid/cholesterol/gamma-HCH transport system substrate-binding protein